jgi:hypothetical protein
MTARSILILAPLSLGAILPGRGSGDAKVWLPLHSFRTDIRDFPECDDPTTSAMTRDASLALPAEAAE